MRWGGRGGGGPYIDETQTEPARRRGGRLLVDLDGKKAACGGARRYQGD